MTRCKYCGVRTTASGGLCLSHKWAARRGRKRVKDEGLTLDQAGGAWWVWDAKGNVLVIGQPTTTAALIMLDHGELGTDDPDGTFEVDSDLAT